MSLRRSFSASFPRPDFPVGIKVLYKPDSACVDICFVHGITGDRETTWTANGQSEPWPKTFLPDKIPQARILTFGYDTFFVNTGGVSTNGLDQHAISLVNDLVTNRRQAKALGRPLIFVAHSLGGIVCKEAIVRSRIPPPNGAHLRDIYDSLSAVAFLGTPHRGTWSAKWASISVSALGFFVNSTNDKLLDVLRIDNELNERTNDNFSSALAERQNENKTVHVTCFFEEMTMAFGSVIVKRASATLDNAIPIGIHANHGDMVKFATPEDTGYKRLSDELERWVEDIVPSQTQKKEREHTIKQDPLYLQCMRDLFRTGSDPEADRNRIERTKGGLINDVYEWIFDNDDFRAWNNAPEKQCLWIRGDPGKGKTMLMSGIITRFAAVERPEVERPVSYFFCQTTDDRLNNALGVLFGLVYCLLGKKPCLISHLQPTYQNRGGKMFDDINAWDTLSAIFTNMCRDEDAQDVVFFIDALDECTTGLSDLLKLVATTHTKVRWIVSSRNELEVEESMAFVENTVPIRLELNKATVSAAVGIYIERKVDELATGKRYTTHSKLTVQRYLSDNAEGTFLWVALVCDVLHKRLGRRHTEDDMRAFPAGLSALYGNMMKTLLDRKDDAPESLRILRTVATVFHPLSLHELATVMYPDETEPELSLLEESVKLCSSFVTIQDDKVYFVHQSAKDYLSDEAREMIYPLAAGYYHLDLCVAALTALTSRLVRDSCQLRYPGTLTDNIEPHQKAPLAPVQYACLFWAEHLEKSHQLPEHDTSQLESTVSKFLQEKFLQWLEAMSLLGALTSVIRSMRTLKHTSRSFSGEIAALVQDAYELAFESRYIIGIAPLQVYASALVFCPSENRVRKCFQAEEPDWITTKPVIQRRQDGLARLEGHRSPIHTINMSSDGSYLVSGSRDQLKIWDMETFICIRTIELDDVPEFVAIPTGGTHVGAVLDFGVAVVWDVKTLKRLRKVNIRQSGEDVQKASFSPCLQRLTVFYETVAVVWDMETAERIRKKHFGQVRVCSSSYTPGNQHVLITTSDEAWIRCCLDSDSWDTVGSGPIHRGELSADGCLLAVESYEKTADIWDLTSPQEAPIATYDIGFSPMSQIIGFTSDGLTIIHHDPPSLEFKCARTGKCTVLRVLNTGDEEWITPDGKRLLCRNGNNITVQDLNHTESENESDDSRGVSDAQQCKFDLTLDGSRLVTASRNHIRLWDTASKAVLHHTTIDHTSGFWGPFVSTDGSRVVLDFTDSLLVWDPAIDNTPRHVHLTNFHIANLGFTPNLRQVVYRTSESIDLLDIDTGNVRSLVSQFSGGCSISLDQKRLACISAAGCVEIFDLSSGYKLHTFTIDNTTPGLEFSFTKRVLVLKRVYLQGFKSSSIIWDTTPIRHDETTSNYRELTAFSYQRGELQVRKRIIYDQYVYSLEPRPGQAKDESETSVYEYNSEENWITFNGGRLLYVPERYQHFRRVMRGQVVCFVPKSDELLAFRFEPDTSCVVSPPPATDLDLERDIVDLVEW